MGQGTGPNRRAFANARQRVAVAPAKRLLHAAALDQAKAHMRRAGRTALSEEDRDVYLAVFDRLFHDLGGVDGWLRMAAV
jgi:hypothetical protein